MHMIRVFPALVLSAASVFAQAPAPTPSPAPSASGPVVPADAKPEGSSWEFRVGGITMRPAERNYQTTATAAASTTGAINGVDVLLRGSGFGISVRSLASQFKTGPQVISADARILLGPAGFSINAGGSRRVFWDTGKNTGTSYDFAVAGVSMTWKIGGSGVRTLISGDAYIPFGAASAAMKGGLEGEAGVIWRMPLLPLFVQAGYRTEVFNAKTGTTQVPEEIRGIRLGAGIQFGGR